MSKRALSVGILTAGLSVGLAAAAISPAAAQGNPVGGQGNGYYLTGAGNQTGQPVHAFAYGNPGDEVYFGNFDNTKAGDEALVRRGNSFILRGTDDEIFIYGDKGDTVLVGHEEAVATTDHRAVDAVLVPVAEVDLVARVTEDHDLLGLARRVPGTAQEVDVARTGDSVALGGGRGDGASQQTGRQPRGQDADRKCSLAHGSSISRAPCWATDRKLAVTERLARTTHGNFRRHVAMSSSSSDARPIDKSTTREILTRAGVDSSSLCDIRNLTSHSTGFL